MKFIKIILPIFLVFALSNIGISQKIAAKSGSAKALKGEKKIHVEYDYSSMGVGKYKKEKDYTDRKVKDYNKDEAGRGDKWLEAWEGDREARFEPKFEELVNEYFDGRKIGNYPDAKYKFVVKTVFTEPGFNIGIMKKFAMVNLVIDVVEQETGKTIAVYTLDKSPGRTYGMGDFDTGVRIKEAYAKAGKEFAKYLVKKVFK